MAEKIFAWDEMKFVALKLTKNGNLLLEGDEKNPVQPRTRLKYFGKEVGFVFETIGSMDSPLYLARVQNGEKLVGKTLRD